MCKPLRDLHGRCGNGIIPVPAWTPELSGIFVLLKNSITISPLLTRGIWVISMEKRCIWETNIFWLCGMKTTYKIIYYTGPIHILQRWCQELLAYNFSCIYRSRFMMVDVDYILCINDNLITTNMLIANCLSLSDRALRPRTYDAAFLDDILSRGWYSVKPSTSHANVHQISCTTFPCLENSKTK